MNNTKVRVKYKFAHELAAEILPIGFETELIPKYSDRDKVIVNEVRRNGKVVSPEQIAPAGSFEGYTFKGANGETYGDYWIKMIVGYKSIGEIFDRIEN